MTYGNTGGAGRHVIMFRRNERDRQPPRSVVTAQFMGDPIGDRLARDREARIRLGIVSDEAPTIPAPLLGVLRALAGGPLRCGELAEHQGVCLSTASKRARDAETLGLVEREGRGKTLTYRLSREGRAELEAQPQ